MTGWFGSSVVECWQMQIYASYEGICVEFERKKQHKISFPTFELLTSTKSLS